MTISLSLSYMQSQCLILPILESITFSVFKIVSRSVIFPLSQCQFLQHSHSTSLNLFDTRNILIVPVSVLWFLRGCHILFISISLRKSHCHSHKVCNIISVPLSQSFSLSALFFLAPSQKYTIFSVFQSLNLCASTSLSITASVTKSLAHCL